jgi:hypothetical protein
MDVHYNIESADDFSNPSWSVLEILTGDGQEREFVDVRREVASRGSVAASRTKIDE